MNHSKRIQNAWNDTAFMAAIDAALAARLQWLDDAETHGADIIDFTQLIDEALKPLLESPSTEDTKQAYRDQLADDGWNTHREPG